VKPAAAHKCHRRVSTERTEQSSAPQAPHQQRYTRSRSLALARTRSHPLPLTPLSTLRSSPLLSLLSLLSLPSLLSLLSLSLHSLYSLYSLSLSTLSLSTLSLYSLSLSTRSTLSLHSLYSPLCPLLALLLPLRGSPGTRSSDKVRATDQHSRLCEKKGERLRRCSRGLCPRPARGHPRARLLRAGKLAHATLRAKTTASRKKLARKFFCEGELSARR